MSQQWVWVKSNTPPKCKLAKYEKQAIQAKADQFVASYYRPHFIKPPPPEPQANYIDDFSTRWHGAYFYFTARYACPGPNTISLFFDIDFARLGYFSRDNYNLWARRHNDQWMLLYENVALPACFERMQNDPWFQF